MTRRGRLCGDANHIFGGGAVPAGGESGVASEVGVSREQGEQTPDVFLSSGLAPPVCAETSDAPHYKASCYPCRGAMIRTHGTCVRNA